MRKGELRVVTWKEFEEVDGERRREALSWRVLESVQKERC
jgi:hypothetical protein